jgi:hypothetical protein
MSMSTAVAWETNTAKARNNLIDPKFNHLCRRLDSSAGIAVSKIQWKDYFSTNSPESTLNHFPGLNLTAHKSMGPF